MGSSGHGRQDAGLRSREGRTRGRSGLRKGSATEMQQKCNRSATGLQQERNASATAAQQLGGAVLEHSSGGHWQGGVDYTGNPPMARAPWCRSQGEAHGTRRDTNGHCRWESAGQGHAGPPLPACSRHAHRGCLAEPGRRTGRHGSGGHWRGCGRGLARWHPGDRGGGCVCAGVEQPLPGTRRGRGLVLELSGSHARLAGRSACLPHPRCGSAPDLPGRE